MSRPLVYDKGLYRSRYNSKTSSPNSRIGDDWFANVVADDVRFEFNPPFVRLMQRNRYELPRRR
ncbi:hypothetical protein XH79_06930 [Bradyrhizobium sp. CCBAU 45389]|nr:hypothetical protein [Bradyrhizobium sp. CCBAU 45389]